MSKHSPDKRKKIASVPYDLGNVRIASQTDVVFPCNMFEVAVPGMSQSPLNIFEETVLKLINLGMTAPAKLVEKTTMEPELVAFILSRLLQTDYIDQHNKLTDKGRRFFRKASEPKEMIRVKVFLELLGGNVLPVIYPRELPLAFSSGGAEGKVRFPSGKAGKSRLVEVYILYEKTEHVTRSINNHDVLRAVKSYLKAAKQNSILRGEESTLVLLENLISINDNPELVYVHCQAVIQTTNNELYVSDGLGQGYSSIFKEHLQRERSVIVTELKRQALEYSLLSDRQTHKTLEIIGFGEPVFRYPEIADSLFRLERLFDDIGKTKIAGENDAKLFSDKLDDFVKCGYGLLEWTLRYVVNATHVVPVPTSLFQEEGGEFLCRCAKKIHLTIPSHYGALLNINAHRIAACQHGRGTDMESLLAVAIFDASQDRLHPLHNIIHHELSAEFDGDSTDTEPQQSIWRNQSFLKFIAALKRQRDTVAHGEQSGIRKEDIAVIRKAIYRFVKELMPTLSGEKIAVQTASSLLDDVNQHYLKSQVALESYFGYNEFRLFDKSTKVLLERIEKNCELNRDDVFGAIIVDLASLVQRVLFLRYKSATVKRMEGRGQEKATALRNAIAAGFELRDEQFGQSVSTVREKFVTAAVKGENRSIGANLIAFLLNTDKETLHQIADKVPKLIELVEVLATKRGHGNVIMVNIDRDEIIQLKQIVYETVKTLQET